MRSRRLSLLLLLVVGHLLAGPVGSALAVCPPPPQQADAVARANAVFVARVLTIENRGRTAEVEVLSVWKGRDLPAQLTLLGGSDDPTVVDPDDRIYQAGQTYLVVSNGFRPPFSDNRCTATQPYNGLPNQVPPHLADVITDAPRPPIPSEPQAEEGGNDAALRIGAIGVGVLIVAVVVGLVTSGGRRFRRRSPGEVAAAARKEARRAETEAASKAKIRKPRRRRLSGLWNGLTGRSGVDQVAKYRDADRKRRSSKKDD